MSSARQTEAPVSAGDERADPRRALVAALESVERYDVIVIGGGATGLGVAVDAASRGFSVALIEATDFAKGTSSRATKLLHGGVRYLAQGDLGLVREALHERSTLLRNAPHLARPLPFVMPVYGGRGRLLHKPLFGAGLVLYDLMAGRAGLGRTGFLSRAATLTRMPGVRPSNLSGAVRYWDGQFDDARLAIALARTAADLGARLLNHCRATRLLRDGDRIGGVVATDVESGRGIALRGRCVINAAGVWVDAIRQLDHPGEPDIVAPSQGVHIVVDREFLPGREALLVPRTEDGRVLFAVPWLGKVILGTTDTPRNDLAAEPRAFPEETSFILREAARYLAKAPTRADVRSIWVGLRPLVRPPENRAGETKALSREHAVLVSHSGLVTVTGGKWTTYRSMAEDVLEQCFERRLIERRGPCQTAGLALHGACQDDAHALTEPPGPRLYGSDAPRLAALPGAACALGGGLTEAMVRFAVREEFARSVEDVLARRSRLLFLDARLAGELAAPVAAILADELGPRFDPRASARAFAAIAEGYLPQAD